MRRFVQAAVAAVVALAPVSPTASHAAAPEDAEPLTVEEITPQAVEPDSTVTIAGTVTNTTGGELDGVTVRFRYSSLPFGSRSELATYADGQRSDPQVFGPVAELEESLEPGGSGDYELAVDAERLTLGGFGVYPLAVDAVDDTGNQLGMVHTFLPYLPDGADPEATEISWLWPLMDHPHRADDDTFLGDSLQEDLAPEGRLSRLLTAGHHDEVPLTWVVDPGLLSDVERLANDDSQVLIDASETPGQAGAELEPQDADVTAGLWLEQAEEALAGQSLLATPYANPDLAALLGADLVGDAESAVSYGHETVERVLGREADTELAMPPSGGVDEAAADFLLEHGARTFVLGESALPAEEYLGYTPTTAVELPIAAEGDNVTDTDTDNADDTVTALVADRQLSQALAADSWNPGNEALALQRFIAETAMVTAEQPSTSRAVLAAPPQGWDPSPGFATELLEASASLPWLDPVPVDNLTADARPAADTGREEFRFAGADDLVLADSYLSRLRSVQGEVRLFNSVLTDDEEPFQATLLRLESAWWDGEETLASQAMERADTAVEEAASQVRILPGEPLTMASNSGEAPILVANDLPYPIAVNLSVFSENSERLSVGNYTETMQIGPGSRTTVHVPLSATVNGRTLLHLRLHNADGEPLNTDETTQSVNVTGLGTSALLISGVAAGLLLVLLLPRAVRKWRRRRAQAD